MNQNDLLAGDMINTFLVDFGESITWVGYGQSPRTIQAIIERDPAAAFPGLSGATVWKHRIQIANDPAAGAAMVHLKKDQVIFASKVGGKPETFAVMEIVHNDAGAWLLGGGVMEGFADSALQVEGAEKFEAFGEILKTNSPLVFKEVGRALHKVGRLDMQTLQQQLPRALAIRSNQFLHSFHSRAADSRLPGVIGAQSGTCKFKLEVYGSGTAGTPPAAVVALFQACGMSQAAGVFTPVSAASAQKTATLVVFEDGKQKSIFGAMGTFGFHGENGKPAYWEFEFKGVWAAPIDAAMTPEFLAAVTPPPFVNVALAIGTWSPVGCSKFSFSMGNAVELRQDINSVSGAGFIAAVITDRHVTGSLDPESTTVATNDVFGAWKAGTLASASLTLGAAGHGVAIAMPVLQYQAIKGADRNGVLTDDLNFGAKQNGTTPDSEITLTF